MKKIILLLSTFCLIFQLAFGQNNHQNTKMQWWRDGKFGLFLHWGLYSVAGGNWQGHPYKGNEHFMLYEKIPWKVYGHTLAPKFNPIKFNADTLVKRAKNAGMKYIVITTKHHDGFAMYNSPTSDYNIVKKTPWGKDPMKLLADACHKYGIKLCFYYSLGRDWQRPVPTHWPKKDGRSNTWDFPWLPDLDAHQEAELVKIYFQTKVIPQVKELLTQYGPVGILWFDTPELMTKEESTALKELIHRLQPHCIINSRIGNGEGDYQVREQKIGGEINMHPWESCVTMSGGWGYNQYDSAWKSPTLLIRQLIQTVSNGGNYLLNIGPKGDGSLPQAAVERLRKIGVWMNRNSEAIYDTKPWKISLEKVADVRPPKEKIKTNGSMEDVLNDNTSKTIVPQIRFTRKGKRIYVFAMNINTDRFSVKALGSNNFRKIKNVSCLGGGKLKWNQTNKSLQIEMPKREKNKINILVFKVQ